MRGAVTAIPACCSSSPGHPAPARPRARERKVRASNSSIRACSVRKCKGREDYTRLSHALQNPFCCQLKGLLLHASLAFFFTPPPSRTSCDTFFFTHVLLAGTGFNQDRNFCSISSTVGAVPSGPRCT